MTQEEKAKAYDEALTKARNIVNSINVGLIGKDSFEAVFPELKESEDERIRKSLIILLQHFCKGYRVSGLDFPVSYKDMLAWLEKQGNKDEEILVLKDQIESLHAAIRALKEAHKIELKKQDEQKPAWSEDDEKIIDGLISICDEAQDGIPRLSVRFSHVEALKNWLKSIKDRIQPQPKQEWSEEDKRNLNDAILFIETGTYSLDKDNLINWLKSLRPQSQWKPSEE